MWLNTTDVDGDEGGRNLSRDDFTHRAAQGLLCEAMALLVADGYFELTRFRKRSDDSRVDRLNCERDDPSFDDLGLAQVDNHRRL
jgi:hypothetical protein